MIESQSYTDYKKNYMERFKRYHDSNDLFIQHVIEQSNKIIKTFQIKEERDRFNDFELIDFIASNYAFYVENIDVNRAVIWFYDYDLKQYTMDSSLLLQAVSICNNKIMSQSKFGQMTKLFKNKKYSMDVRSLNHNELPMKNKVVNYETFEQIEYSPDLFVKARIDNEYKKIDEHPVTSENLNIFDIIKTTANHNEERYLGLLQIARQSLLKQNLGDSIIQLLGPGGRGKSMYANFIKQIIGERNVSTISLDQFSNKDDVMSINNAYTVIGDDIDDDVYINKLKNLKSISSGNSITISPKYEKAMNVSYSGPIIQLTPNIIKMNERNGQMKRRIKPYSFECDFTKEENRIDSNLLKSFLENKEVQQYFIYQILNMEELKHLNEFVGWSKELLEEITDQNDDTSNLEHYIETRTTILQMERIPMSPLKGIYLDLKEAGENSKAANIQTKEITSRLYHFFKKHGYERVKRRQITPKRIEEYLEPDLNEFNDHDTQDMINAITHDNHHLRIDNRNIGPHLAKILKENKPTTYMEKTY